MLAQVGTTDTHKPTTPRSLLRLMKRAHFLPSWAHMSIGGGTGSEYGCSLCPAEGALDMGVAGPPLTLVRRLVCPVWWLLCG